MFQKTNPHTLLFPDTTAPRSNTDTWKLFQAYDDKRNKTRS